MELQPLDWIIVVLSIVVSFIPAVVLGCLFVYAALFGTGSILYGKWPQAWMWIVVFVASGGGLVRLLPRMWGQGTTTA